MDQVKKRRMSKNIHMFHRVFKGLECPICQNGLILYDKGLPVFRNEIVELRKQNNVFKLCAVIIRPEEMKAAQYYKKRFQITVLSNKHVELMKKYFITYGICKERVINFFSAKGVTLSYVFEKLELICPFLEKHGKNIKEIFHHFLRQKRSIKCVWNYIILSYLYYINPEYRENLRKWNERKRQISADARDYPYKNVEIEKDKWKERERHAQAHSKETCDKQEQMPIIMSESFVQESANDLDGKQTHMTDKCETNMNQLLGINNNKIFDENIQNNENFESKIIHIHADAKPPETAIGVEDGSPKNFWKLINEDNTENMLIMLDYKDSGVEQLLYERLSDFEDTEICEKKTREDFGVKEILAQNDVKSLSETRKSEIKQQ